MSVFSEVLRYINGLGGAFQTSVCPLSSAWSPGPSPSACQDISWDDSLFPASSLSFQTSCPLTPSQEKGKLKVPTHFTSLQTWSISKKSQDLPTHTYGF